MSESSPSNENPEANPAAPSVEKIYSPLSPPPPEKAGCLSLAAGAFLGFFLFVFCGLGLGQTTKNGGLLVAYLIVAFVGAVWLATKPNWRGMAIGIFLGFGVLLLLIAICGNMRF